MRERGADEQLDVDWVPLESDTLTHHFRKR